MRLRRLGLVVDFDGTISEIAPTPDEATVSRDCAEALEHLAEKLRLVAVASGRSAASLKEKTGLARLVYIGNHGAEYLDGERVEIAPEALAFREPIMRVFDRLRSTADGPGLVWQDKGVSVSVHYRLAPDTARARRTLMTALKSAPGAEKLDVFWGKAVLELRAPVGLDKGHAIRRLAKQWKLDGVIFIGDDITDLDAMRALGDLMGARTVLGARVAVVYDDSPEEVLTGADYGLAGVGAVGEFLRWMDRVTR